MEYSADVRSTVLDTLRVVAIPTRTRFRGVTVREAALFQGPAGWAEFSPFLEYEVPEASNWLAAALAYAYAAPPMLNRSSIPVNATVPAVPAAQVPEILARFPGCKTVKVKVAEKGQDLKADLARLLAVRDATPAGTRIRIDANCGWSVAEAHTALLRIALAGIELEYAEQPCQTVPELTQLRGLLRESFARELPGIAPTRIAADESVRKASDPLAVAKAGAADLLIVKAQPLGGVHRALQIVGEAGLPVVVSSALDTSIGIGQGLQLAAALPPNMLAGACGLGTVALLTGDTAKPSLIPENGEIAVRRPEPNEELLERYAATPERRAWWEERIRDCFTWLQDAGTRPEPPLGS